MNKFVAGWIAIALVLIAGCAGQGPSLASSAEDIVGSWRSNIGATEFHFQEDGTFLVTTQGPVTQGEYWFEGTRLFLEQPRCEDLIAVVGIYEVQPLENGNLRFIAIEDECQTRVGYLVGRTIGAEWAPVP